MYGIYVYMYEIFLYNIYIYTRRNGAFTMLCFAPDPHTKVNYASISSEEDQKYAVYMNCEVCHMGKCSHASYCSYMGNCTISN